jgi:hypothetical protein
MAFSHFVITFALEFTLGALFYPALRLPRPARTATLAVCVAGILVAPILIPPRAGFLRLLAAVNAVMVGARVYDEYWAASCGEQTGWFRYLASLENPFAVVLRRAAQEPHPARRADVLGAIVGLLVGAAAVFLLIHLFTIDWQKHSFIAEHCAKAITLFLIIQFLPNGLAAGARLVGLPATNFGGAFFLARTPAEFWRLYNRPAEQFFYEHVFKPARGRRRIIFATLMTFAVSGIIHEYVFDLPAGRILGSQMAFFMIEGIAVAATLRLRPRGWLKWPAIVLTFVFNVAAVRIFLASVNAVVPFYVNR